MRSPLARVGAAAVLEGLGTAVPDQVVTNEDLAAHLDTSDEWIRTRTGIAQRRVADASTSTIELAAAAGAAALDQAEGADCDAVVVATMTPERTCPASAPLVAARLGLDEAAAFDVHAVCSGFVYGLASAAGLLASGIAGRVCVIGADVMSRVVNPTDRSTAVLFGDGAGAVVLRAGDPEELGALGAFDLGSDGAQADLISVAAGGSRAPLSPERVAAGEHYLTMEGKAVYRESITRMVASSETVLGRAGWTVADVDRFVGHQANARILTAVADRLGVDPQRRAINIDRYGNTAAATIPLALADAHLRAGERVLVTAFGAGLSWGSVTFTWPNLPPAA